MDSLPATFEFRTSNLESRRTTNTCSQYIRVPAHGKIMFDTWNSLKARDVPMAQDLRTPGNGAALIGMRVRDTVRDDDTNGIGRVVVG